MPGDQDAPHRLGGGGEEVPPPVPGQAGFGADQPQVRLVDQRCRLECRVGCLAGELRGRQSPQLVVDQRQELPGRAGVAALDARGCW